jgi:type VI protein secretion system component VasK
VRLLRVPVDVSRAPTAGAIQAEIQSKWALLVAEPFRKTLSGKYPVAESPQEATPYEFNEFFKPGGTIWSFYDGHLQDYMRPDGSPVNPDEPSNPVPDEIANCIRRANEIREALYSGDAEQPKLAFYVQTGPPDGQTIPIRWVSFDVGGGRATYQMGPPQWQPLEWPGADPNLGANLRLMASGAASAESRTHLGFWGLFRLLDQGQYVGVEGGVPRVAWHLSGSVGDVRVTYLFQVSAARHPFSHRFLRLEVPGVP